MTSLKTCLAAGTIAVAAWATSPASAAEYVVRHTGSQAGDVLTYKPLPKRFDPAKATATRIAELGLPPRPDSSKDPQGYQAWLQDVSPDIKRVLADLPVARETTRRKPPTPGMSDNWSGFRLQNDTTRFGRSSIQQVHGTWTVPSVAAPAGVTCAEVRRFPGYEAFIWVGIDGLGLFGEKTLLQAGSGATLHCNNGTITTKYYNWFEFVPYDSTTIDNLQPRPGDVISVYIWATSPTEGHAHLVNRTRQHSVSLAFAPQPGDALIGYSAEWIVERPTLLARDKTQVLSALPNYRKIVIGEASAVTGTGDTLTPGGELASPDIRTTKLSMDDPDNDFEILSVAKLLNKRTIQFRATGNAVRAD